ncbi:MAG TPA: cysteine--tRNA ligase [Caldilineaceae bacterium]|nr:cysteine--tRNA ligase [Caldilineaceae bacterium]
MRLYNSQSQTVELFVPRGEPVTIYVCGITPYDTTHVGHAFTYVMADVLIRYLEWSGHTVRYVQNVTDIDDDILRRAAEVGEPWDRLGNRWTAHFIRDMQQLNVRPPDYFPRATSAIPQIIESVQALLEAGLAYESGGSVYYHVAANPHFGRLSHLPPDQMLEIANERGNRPDDPHKLDPLDFVLWQAQAPGEPAWDSPWGPGRPGWHIECSTLAHTYLGATLDLHGGGSDLIFPHHECEIAQLEPLTGAHPFVRCWFHTAMVRHQGEKMSKSLGNLVMVRDLLQTVSADALRLYLAGHHYRREWSFEEAELDPAARLAQQLAAAASLPSDENSPPLETAHFRERFRQAMDDDLNTPAALDVLVDLATTIQTAAGCNVAPAQAELAGLAGVFGLRLHAGDIEARVRSGWAAHLRNFPVEESR